MLAMDRTYLRRLKTPDSDEILNDLSNRQHLFPRRALSQVLAESAEAIGFCPAAAARSVAWLQLDGSAAIGRLRRTELAQLARCVYRFWRQSLADETAAAPAPQRA
jgi:hypothetical protein